MSARHSEPIRPNDERCSAPTWCCRCVVCGAPTRAVTGRNAVARLSVGTLRFLPAGATSAFAEINGQPAVVLRAGGRTVSVIAIEVAGQRISAVRVIANPDKLHWV